MAATVVTVLKMIHVVGELAYIALAAFGAFIACLLILDWIGKRRQAKKDRRP